MATPGEKRILQAIETSDGATLTVYEDPGTPLAPSLVPYKVLVTSADGQQLDLRHYPTELAALRATLTLLSVRRFIR